MEGAKWVMAYGVARWGCAENEAEGEEGWWWIMAGACGAILARLRPSSRSTRPRNRSIWSSRWVILITLMVILMNVRGGSARRIPASIAFSKADHLQLKVASAVVAEEVVSWVSKEEVEEKVQKCANTGEMDIKVNKGAVAQIKKLSAMQAAVLAVLRTKRECHSCRKSAAQCTCVLGVGGTEICSHVDTCDEDMDQVHYKLRLYHMSKVYNKKRCLKGELWNLYFSLNDLKVKIHMMENISSGSNWKRKLAIFIVRCWRFEGDTSDWTAKSAVYIAFKLYSRGSYIGETSLNFHQRMKTHIMTCFGHNYKQTFHKRLLDYGAHNFVFMPLCLWQNDVGKYKRLRFEAACIQKWKPKYNKAGTKSDLKSKIDHSSMIFGRSRKFRPYKRIRDKVTGKSKVLPVVSVQVKRFGFGNLSKWLELKGKCLSWATRLARRPFKTKDQNLLSKLNIVKRIRNANPRVLREIIKIGYSFFDVGSRSIFIKNIKDILMYSDNFQIIGVRINASILNVPGAKSIILKNVQDFADKCYSKGLVIGAYVKISAKSSPSMFQMFDNTNDKGQFRYSQFVCNCNSDVATKFRKVEGHVCQPLMEGLRLCGMNVPHEWSAKDRMIPTWNSAIEPVINRLESISDKMSKMKSKTLQGVSKIVDDHKDKLKDELQDLWNNYCTENEFNKSMVRMTECAQFMYIKDYFVICPVDKCLSDCMITCEHRWGDAVERFLRESMNFSVVSEETISRWYMHRIFELSNKLEYMPYAKLRNANHHRPGIVRMFLKLKSLDESIVSWDTMKWRPLVSYYNHHYRTLFSYISKFLNFCIYKLRLGKNVSNPRVVVRDVNHFNDLRDRLNKYSKLVIYNRDVKDFFTNVSRTQFIDTVKECITRLRNINPQYQFFCLSRNATSKLPQGLGARSGTQLGWRQVLPIKSNTTFLSTSLKKGTICFHFNDILKTIKYDFKYNLVIANGVVYTQREGLAMGNPFSPGGANVTTSMIEAIKQETAPVPTVRAFDESQVQWRWVDDSQAVAEEDRPPEVERYARGFRDPDAYGNRLVLEAVESPESFGFEFYIDENERIRVRTIPKYRSTMNKWSCNINVKNMYNYNQFSCPRVKAGVCKGYVQRVLDGSNVNEVRMEKDITRLLIEMRMAGFPQKCLEKALKSCQSVSLNRIPYDCGVWKWSEYRLECEKVSRDLKDKIRMIGQVNRWR